MAHPAVSVEQVHVYTQQPARFEEIAVLRASHHSVTSAGGERAIAKIIEKMREQAAQLGANGLLLENLSVGSVLDVGAGVGTQIYTDNANIGLGVASSVGLATKMGEARAIFVLPPG